MVEFTTIYRTYVSRRGPSFGGQTNASIQNTTRVVHRLCSCYNKNEEIVHQTHFPSPTSLMKLTSNISKHEIRKGKHPCLTHSFPSFPSLYHDTTTTFKHCGPGNAYRPAGSRAQERTDRRGQDTKRCIPISFQSLIGQIAYQRGRVLYLTQHRLRAGNISD